MLSARLWGRSLSLSLSSSSSSFWKPQAVLGLLLQNCNLCLHSHVALSGFVSVQTSLGHTGFWPALVRWDLIRTCLHLLTTLFPNKVTFTGAWGYRMSTHCGGHNATRSTTARHVATPCVPETPFLWPELSTAPAGTVKLEMHLLAGRI